MLIDRIGPINNTLADNAKYLDVAMLMYNLLEYCDNNAKTSGRLWQYYRDESADDEINSKTFKFKLEFIEKTDTTGLVNVKIVVLLHYLGKFWRALEMPLSNNLIQNGHEIV